MQPIGLGTFDLFRRTIVTFYVLLLRAKMNWFALSSANRQLYACESHHTGIRLPRLKISV